MTCSRAGSEYGLALTWTLVFGSVLAFTLQEGTARLTIHSGLSLGQCLRSFFLFPILRCFRIHGSDLPQPLCILKGCEHPVLLNRLPGL